MLGLSACGAVGQALCGERWNNFLMRGKIGSKYFYFKALLLLMFIENKKHLVFGSKTLDSRAIK